MLDDRDYMREPYRRLRWSATVTLLVINAVVFLLGPLIFRVVDEGYFVLSLAGLKHGFVWQLLTYQFLHDGWLHIIFNSLALFFFGRVVEMMLGRNRFLQLYFASGIIGGLVQMLFAAVLPRMFNGGVVGASAAVSGLIAAFAVMNWRTRFTVLVFFVLPVTISGMALFWASIVLAIIGILSPGHVAHAAHLGGLLAGAAFVRFNWGSNNWRLSLPAWSGWRRRGQPRRSGVTKMPRWPASRSAISADLPEEEFISQEVDPILEKISAHGIQSLTQREREILEKARNKMAKR